MYEKYSPKDDDKALAKMIKEAMSQIDRTRYTKGVEGYNTVIAVGIAYANRRCKAHIEQADQSA